MTASSYMGVVIHMGACTHRALHICASANNAGKCTYSASTFCCAHPTSSAAQFIACKASRAIPFITFPDLQECPSRMAKYNIPTDILVQS